MKPIQLGLALLGALLLSACSATQQSITATPMTMQQWSAIKKACKKTGTEIFSRLGNQEDWSLNDYMADKNCIKSKIKAGGFIEAVYFKPDEMPELNREPCDIYAKDDVVINGTDIQRRWGDAYATCQQP